jgi:hypothetical protein
MEFTLRREKINYILWQEEMRRAFSRHVFLCISLSLRTHNNICAKNKRDGEGRGKQEGMRML